MNFRAFCIALAAVALLGTPALAGPAATDTNYFDGFLDEAGIDPFSSADVELDALGGIRLKGNGASTPALWTTGADFLGWVSYLPDTFIDNPLIPVSTLSGTATPGSLTLSPTPLALRRVQEGPVLGPPPALSVDGYGVGGMSVVLVGSEFFMYYTGFPEDGFTKRIYLATSTDGVNWAKVATPVLDLGAPGTFDSRQLGKPSVLYDPAPLPGMPAFRMWYSAEGDLYGSIGYATSDDGYTWEKWVEPITVPDSVGNVGSHASLAIGADGLPIVAYHDADNGDLKFLRCGNASCSSANTVVTLDAEGDVGEYASLAVGVDGLPVVAYYDATNGDLRLLHCGTAACTLGNTITILDGVTPEADVGQYASLRLGPAGFPFVAYYDADLGDLKAVACNDALCAGGDETVSIVDDGAGSDVGRHASVALVATDPLNPASTTFPAVAYYDASGGDLRLVVCNDPLCSGGDETPGVLAGAASDAGQFASLGIGAGGFPVVAYYDATGGDLGLISCNDPFCSGGDDLPVPLDASANDVGQYASLAVGAGGFPAVAYYDATEGNLLLIRCNDAACADGDDLPTVVDGEDPPADVGRYVSLALGAGGLPFMAYYDATGEDLKVAPAEREPREVLGPGIIGSIDSFTVSQPCVLYENGSYRMWYTADDSNNRRIAYATSTDAVTWVRGGLMIDVGNTANDSLGAWSPAVWKEGENSYRMVYTGWKEVSGGNVVQSKLINAASSDGTTWATGNVTLGAGNNDDFDGYNLFLPNVILVDDSDPTSPVYNMWYVGNNPDANGNFHDRIGLAQKTGTGANWGNSSKIIGPLDLGSVLSLGTQGTALDSMSAADIAPVADPGGVGLIGFYTGTNAADFKPRIGAKRSEDGGVTWAEMPLLITPGSPVIDAGPGGAFDEGGVARPAPVDLGTEWAVYHTSLGSDLTPSIGLHTVSHDFGTVTRSPAALIAGGSDPAALLSQDGLSILLYYASESGGIWSLSRASYDAAAPGSQTAAPAALVFDEDPLCWDLDASGSCDPAFEDLNGDGFCTVQDCHPLEAGGMRHPVVTTDGALWQLWYTALGSDGVERIAYAESGDGMSWTRQGLAVDRSTTPYDFAEKGIRPSGVVAGTSPQLFVTGVDRAGWMRAGLLAGSGPGFADAGTATYQYPSDDVLADPAYLPRDWRAISWNPPAVADGTKQEVWVSYYPTASDMWSNFFRIDNGRDLPFLLTVEAMRWQVRLAGDALDATVGPQLDDLTVDNADISFPASGRAVTIPVGPPAGRYLLAWEDLTVDAEANGGTVSVEIYDEEGTPLVGATPVTGGGWTTSLAGVPATSGKLRLAFTLTPDTVASPPESPLLKSVNVTFSSTDVPSSITLVATPASLYSGQETSVAGWLESRTLNPDGSETVTPLPGQLVTLRTRTATEGTWTFIDDVTTAGDGSFAFPPQGALAESRYFRAEWPGNVDIGGTVYPPAASSVLVEVSDPPVVLTLDASTPSVLYGKPVVLNGSLTSSLGAFLANQTVTIRQRPAGAADFTDLATPLVLAVAPDGSFTTAGERVLKPKVNTEYQAVWAGGDALGSGIVFPETTAVARVGVRPRVTIGLGGYTSRSGKYYIFPAGSSIRISGRVTPKHYLLHDGATRGAVVVDVFKLKRVDGVLTWVPDRNRTRLLGKGRRGSPYAWKWTVRARGKYRTHATFPGESHHDGSVSPWRYFRVN